jgi:hypothetical protein
MHCTSSGNAGVREFAALFGRGGQKVLYAPDGELVVERRILFLLYYLLQLVLTAS